MSCKEQRKSYDTGQVVGVIFGFIILGSAIALITTDVKGLLEQGISVLGVLILLNVLIALALKNYVAASMCAALAWYVYYGVDLLV